jgi:sugar phosphate isomerase/epimerase
MMGQISIALQLYTVRNALKKDFVGMLKKVKEIGYEAVQLNGFIPYSSPQLREILQDIRLKVVGVHVFDFKRLKENLDEYIKFCKIVDTQDIVLAVAPEEHRYTLDGWEELANILNEMGKRCRQENMRFSYHNHSFEFMKFGEKHALDILLEKSDPSNLFVELDTYWIKDAGENPAAYIRKYSGRCPLLHIKDMTPEKGFAEIGNGILDWKEIFHAAEKSKVEWCIVEQDACAEDPLISIATSLSYMRIIVPKYFIKE